METWNTVLGIVASVLSILAILFSKVTSDRTKRIEKMINQKLDVRVGSSRDEKNTNKKAVSGDQGISIVGDSNKVNGDR